MKVIYGTLGAMLAELRERKVEAVRIARFIQSEAGRTTGIPWYASRIVVTAPLGERMWAECRLSAGRGMGELAEGAVRLPEALRQHGEKLLAEVTSEERRDLLFPYCHRFTLKGLGFFTFSAEPVLAPGTVTPGYALRLT